MRTMSIAALFLLTAVGCAARRQPAVSTDPPPLPEPTSVDKLPDPDPYRRPTMLVRAPGSWVESDAAADGDVTFVHDSGHAMITVMLRNTDDVALADHAERLLVGLGDNVTTSLIMTTAGGDRAWFSWTRHPSKTRPAGAEGKIILIRFPTMPERMAVVSGIWRPEMNLAMVTAMNEVAASVALR